MRILGIVDPLPFRKFMIGLSIRKASRNFKIDKWKENANQLDGETSGQQVCPRPFPNGSPVEFQPESSNTRNNNDRDGRQMETNIQ